MVFAAEIIQQFDAIMRQRTEGYHYEMIIDNIAYLNANLDRLILKQKTDDFLLYIVSEPITSDDDSCSVNESPLPEDIYYFTFKQDTYAALLYRRYDLVAETIGELLDFWGIEEKDNGNEEISEDDNFAGMDKDDLNPFNIPDSKKEPISIFDLREQDATSQLISAYRASTETKYMPQFSSDNPFLSKLVLLPERYFSFTLPTKEGMKTIRLGNILKCNSDIMVGSSEHYHPLIRQSDIHNGALYAMLIADEQHEERIRTFDSLCFLNDNNVHTPYIFDSNECGTSQMLMSWRIDTRTVFPQYLLMQLYEQYAKNQYVNAIQCGFTGNFMLDHVLIYVPEGDADMSIWEQQRLFNEYRTHEIQQFSSFIGANVNPTGALPIGTMLQRGRYKIKDSLSNGGFGKVYLASNKQNTGQFDVAIKELFVKEYSIRQAYSNNVAIVGPHTHDFEHQKRTFQDEFELLYELSCNTQYVPTIYNKVFEENNTLYYAMQYVNNGTLWEHIRNHDLTTEQILRVICHAGIALHHAHNLHRLHLDVTPMNIMLNEKCEGILIDFGNSKHYSIEDQLITSTSYAAKTVQFAPPEMINQERGHYYMQTDVYGLAITLYYAMTRCLPPSRSKYGDEYFIMEISQNLNGVCADPSLTDTIIKALNHDSSKRHSTILEFLKSLPEELLGQDTVQEIAILHDVEWEFHEDPYHGAINDINIDDMNMESE